MLSNSSYLNFFTVQVQPERTPGDHVAVLYQEIENLKRQLGERDYHIVQMETAVMNHATDFPDGEWEALQETLRFWQEKYERLLESHKKLQKVNQALEDKLLRLVDKFESEKSMLTRDVADLTTKLVEARVMLTEVEEENESYKSDCAVAVHLLQCKPSNFVSHKFNTVSLCFHPYILLHGLCLAFILFRLKAKGMLRQLRFFTFRGSLWLGRNRNEKEFHD